MGDINQEIETLDHRNMAVADGYDSDEFDDERILQGREEKIEHEENEYIVSKH